MSKLRPSLNRTLTFLAVTLVLQACGAGGTDPDNSQASAEAPLTSVTPITPISPVTSLTTDNVDNVDNSEVIAAALPEEPDQTLGGEAPTLGAAAPTDGEPTPDETPVFADENIILGSSAGDAMCLHLGDENEGVGSVSDSDWDRWLSEFHFSIGEQFLAVEPQGEGSTALRQRFIPSSIGTDRATVGARLPAYRTYRITQSFYFEPGFDWGGRFEGGKLGFGFGGGTRPTGGTVDPNGFSSRLMWRGNGDGTGRVVIYSYSADRPDRFGEDIRFGDVNVPIGEWFTVIMEVTTNSSTQVSDGTMRGWINGELVLERQNVGWQLAGDTPIVDYLYYSGFYGGNSTDWSPSSTTHMKTRDVCWAPVVDGYSGIDPDNGRLVVATTENPSGPFADMSEENEFEATVSERQRRLLGSAEETLINIRSVAPVASLLTQRSYDETIAELTQIVINAGHATNRSLSGNPVPLLQNAAKQLEFALTINEENTLQTEAIVNAQDALRVVALRASALAVAVVENVMNVSSCGEVTSSSKCSESNEILIEISSLLESIRPSSTSIDETFFTTEVIWNRSVDALNSLN